MPDAMSNNGKWTRLSEPEAAQIYSCSVSDVGTESTSTCYGFRRSNLRTALYLLGCVLSLGIMALVMHWKPHWKLKVTHVPCTLNIANKVLLVDQFGIMYVEAVLLMVQAGGGACYPSLASCLPVSPPLNESSALLNDDAKKNRHFRISECGKFFVHKHCKYIWNDIAGCFVSLTGLDGTATCPDLYAMSCGLNDHQRRFQAAWYGPNTIDVEVRSYLRLFFEESANPFYIFQILSCMLWFSDNYYYYASAIIVLSVSSLVISTYQTRQHLVNLRNMIAHSREVSVLKSDGKTYVMPSSELVPGDVVVIPQGGCTLLCDAALISGTVIVNESMLTGESVPVTKTPIPREPSDELFDPVKQKRHTLFCGTMVLQTRFYGDARVLAVVVRTGYLTTKGSLVKSILFPKPVDFKFFSDALKFVGLLFFLAFLGFCYSFYVFVRDHASAWETFRRALDVITIAVPPALPAAMSVGTVYALQRLRKENIFCISPSRINVSGKIKLLCFDKTGTLTEDGLHLCGTIRAENMSLQTLGESLSFTGVDQMTMAMATCHSLTILDGAICGDPLDLQMFEATGWTLEEAGEETQRFENIIPTIVKPKSVDEAAAKHLVEEKMPMEIAILKQFTFSSELQRMSVVTRTLGAKNMVVYAKGSPEIIVTLCDPSTVPKSFSESLTSYTQQGYRVLALAWKPLDPRVHWHKVQHFQRQQAESDLLFLGLIVMKNMLKPDTAPIIRELYDAHIRVVMVTGDNILTAVSVARECGIVKPGEKVLSVTATLSKERDKPELTFHLLGELDGIDGSSCSQVPPSAHFLQRNYHFAVLGKDYALISRYFPELYQKILATGTVFARMLPDQKTQLVEDLQGLGYGVGMCGDGANDCGALKRAHAGISLSEAEASVASPFTSKVANISCVTKVIKEGRCALVTSFSVFKYMALYSMVQYMAVLILYWVRSNLGNFEFLYIDLIIILPFAVTMSRTRPYPKLVPQRPLGSLIHASVLFSIVSQMAVQLVAQIAAFLFVQSTAFYKSPDVFRGNRTGDLTQIVCYENTALFCVSAYQYILLAVIFSIGRPYRKPLFTNYAMLFCVVILTASNIALTYHPLPSVAEFVQLARIDGSRYYIFFATIVTINLILSYVLEGVVLPSSYLRALLRTLRRKRLPKNKYKLVLKDIAADPAWPPSPGL